MRNAKTSSTFLSLARVQSVIEHAYFIPVYICFALAFSVNICAVERHEYPYKRKKSEFGPQWRVTCMEHCHAALLTSSSSSRDIYGFLAELQSYCIAAYHSSALVLKICTKKFATLF